jgi:phosphohistidine phosphatase
VRLYLLRHAKSSWDEPGLADHDRPLARRGKRAADAMGRYMREHGIEPEVVLCSSATRTRQTLERLGLPDARIEPELYGADAATLRALIPDASSAMLIGHNPGMQDLALSLARSGAKLGELAEKFPTGALATIELDTGELVDFVRPRDLA